MRLPNGKDTSVYKLLDNYVLELQNRIFTHRILTGKELFKYMFYRTKPRLQQGLHLDNMMKSETINHRSQGKGLQYSEHFF